MHTVWFLLLSVMLVAYVVLDGFDLGAGIVHLFVGRSDRERRIVLNAIGPFWDGNEVWLIALGASLFAAFPTAYASIFSAFYVPFMLLLFFLILRAVSLEFRSKVESVAWRTTFDLLFSLSSLLASLLLGVAAANVVQGLMIGHAGEPQGSWLEMLGPYPLAVGVLTVLLFALHGAAYLGMKTRDALADRCRQTARCLYPAVVFCWIIAGVLYAVVADRARDQFMHNPLGWLLLVLNVITLGFLGDAIRRRGAGAWFAGTSFTIITLCGLFATTLYPNLAFSSIAPAYDLDIYNSASSEYTLRVMGLIAAVGLPLGLVYNLIVYRAMRGRVVLDELSY